MTHEVVHKKNVEGAASPDSNTRTYGYSHTGEFYQVYKYICDNIGQIVQVKLCLSGDVEYRRLLY